MNNVIKGAGFHHIALASNCFEKSLEFYNGLGFKVIAKWSDGAMLDMGNGDIIEIFNNGTDQEETNARFFHLAIKADDPDEAYRIALSLGAKSKIEPKNCVIGAEEPINIRIAFVYGPSDEVIEFFKYN